MEDGPLLLYILQEQRLYLLQCTTHSRCLIGVKENKSERRKEKKQKEKKIMRKQGICRLNAVFLSTIKIIEKRFWNHQN